MADAKGWTAAEGRERCDSIRGGELSADEIAAMRDRLSRVRETRRSRGTPYPRDLRARVIAFVRSRRLAGSSYQDLSRLLGMHASTLQLWITSGDKLSRDRRVAKGETPCVEPPAPETPPIFAPVRVVEERAAPVGEGARPCGAECSAAPGRLVLHAPGGLRLEGLSALDAARVLERLLESRR